MAIWPNSFPGFIGRPLLVLPCPFDFSSCSVPYGIIDIIIESVLHVLPSPVPPYHQVMLAPLVLLLVGDFRGFGMNTQSSRSIINSLICIIKPLIYLVSSGTTTFGHKSPLKFFLGIGLL